MSIQILNVVIYSFDSKIETIDFKPGKLNIITGASKTGKTSLIDIIDYCFGSKNCEIADGIIPSNVEWVGVRLQITEGELFISRKMPEKGKKTSYDIYFEIKKKVNIPEHSELRKLISLDDLKDILSQYVGISENIHIPPKGQTRRELEATIRHSLVFTFQKQDEISNRKYLFHNQSDYWSSLAMKDTLPYFLGAVVYDYIGKLNKLKILRRKLNSKKKKLAEFEAIQDKGKNLCHNLLSEAKNYGLYSKDIPEDPELCIEELKKIQNNLDIIVNDVIIENSALDKLKDEKLLLMKERDEINDKIKAYRLLDQDRMEFSDELDDHLLRLRSIELFENDSQTNDKCPVCSSILSESQLPSIDTIKESIKDLEHQMRIVEERSPQMDKTITALNTKLEEIQFKIEEKNDEIKYIYQSQKKIEKIRDENSKKSYILGKIGLYLESTSKNEDNTNLKAEIVTLEENIKVLEDEVSEDRVHRNTDRIISILSKYMNEFALKLKLEYAKYPLRLDVKKLTVLVDKDDEDITTTMDKMGSAENWLGSHIITHFALHKWFVNKNRPIPRFLFIDQPSQVYFPSEKDFIKGNENEDYDAVKRIYKLAYELANELSPHFQIIMTDHADIDEEWFDECVIERWRDGNKLVPMEWYK